MVVVEDLLTLMPHTKDTVCSLVGWKSDLHSRRRSETYTVYKEVENSGKDPDVASIRERQRC